MPQVSWQTCRVDKTPEKTLADNLTWLMKNSADYNSQAKVGAKAGIDQKTVGRIMNKTNFPTLDKLTALAAVFGVEAWQLIAPRLGADLYKIDADRRVVPVQPGGPPAPANEKGPMFRLVRKPVSVSDDSPDVEKMVEAYRRDLQHLRPADRRNRHTVALLGLAGTFDATAEDNSPGSAPAHPASAPAAARPSAPLRQSPGKSVATGRIVKP
jgi:hypothetical protein